MAKNAGDVILRDRMQFTMEVGGDRSTLYGRIDLSSYVDPVNRQGLAVKEVRFQIREPDAAGVLDNTGIWAPVGNWVGSSGAAGDLSALKLYATTRAYENASEVGIASPDVLCVYEIIQAAGNHPADTASSLWIKENWYGPKDLHPEGYTVVSDLLIGVAADGWDIDTLDTLEVDIMMIAEPVSISTAVYDRATGNYKRIGFKVQVELEQFVGVVESEGSWRGFITEYEYREFEDVLFTTD